MKYARWKHSGRDWILYNGCNWGPFPLNWPQLVLTCSMTSCISKRMDNCRVGRVLASTYVLSQPTPLNQQSRNGSQMPAALILDHAGMSLWPRSAGRPEKLLYTGFIGKVRRSDGQAAPGQKISLLLHNNLFHLCEDC